MAVRKDDLQATLSVCENFIIKRDSRPDMLFAPGNGPRAPALALPSTCFLPQASSRCGRFLALSDDKDGFAGTMAGSEAPLGR